LQTVFEFSEHAGSCGGQSVIQAAGGSLCEPTDQNGITSVRRAIVLIVSNFALPRAAFQPDSGKIMIRWGPEPGKSLWFREMDAKDYWDGE
jgi:hypothetical protein